MVILSTQIIGTHHMGLNFREVPRSTISRFLPPNPLRSPLVNFSICAVPRIGQIQYQLTTNAPFPRGFLLRRYLSVAVTEPHSECVLIT